MADALGFLTFTLRQGFAAGETEIGLGLHGNNPEPLMSALGQKQTSDCRLLMSAVTPKADIDPSASDVRFVPKADI
jgi:hypothetical protein